MLENHLRSRIHLLKSLLFLLRIVPFNLYHQTQKRCICVKKKKYIMENRHFQVQIFPLSFLVQCVIVWHLSDGSLFFQFQEGVTLPQTYAFALVEYRDGREKLKLRTFLSGEVKQINMEEIESSSRLLKMLSILKATNSFLWILKV